MLIPSLGLSPQSPMNTEVPSTSSSGLPSPEPAISPLQQIGTTQNHDTFNNNHRSFNTTSHRTDYNFNFTIQPSSHGRVRRVSVAPSLASVASEDSGRDPEKVVSEGKEVRVSEHGMSIALNSESSLSQASTSQDGNTPVKGRPGNVRQDSKHAASNSRASYPQISASHGHVHIYDGEVTKLFGQKTNPPVLKRWNCGPNSTLRYALSPPTPQEDRIASILQKVDDYVPDGMDRKYKNYMRSPHLAQINAIPVWNSSPIRGVNVRRRIRIDVGDVGTFTRRGGFRVAFNLLLDEKTNKSCGYDVPKNFSQFVPPLTREQKRSCSIKDDGIVIDLDHCGAIDSEGINCPDALLHGFKPKPCTSSWEPFTTRCDISPEAGKDERRGYIYLPDGAKIYSFSSRASRELTRYLNACVEDWVEYLNRLWHQEKAPPMIVTSVWAARSFACATYTVRPPKISAVAQVWTAAKGDKIYWARASEGFETARAPLDDGYDENGKLKSQVEDQCFGIEGYVLKSRREVSKLHASLVTI